MLGRTSRDTPRAAPICLVLLQLAAVVALPSADAMLEAERVGLPLHVESPQSEECPASHDHLICLMVRSLTAASITPDIGKALDLAPPVYGGVTLAARGDADRGPSLKGPTPPRPPPLG
jgi:hypothetical protein